MAAAVNAGRKGGEAEAILFGTAGTEDKAERPATTRPDVNVRVTQRRKATGVETKDEADRGHGTPEEELAAQA